jgi:hypothetical protein
MIDRIHLGVAFGLSLAVVSLAFGPDAVVAHNPDSLVSKTSIAAPSRTEVVAWMRHQEELVRTAECAFTVRRHATSPDMIPHIHEVMKTRTDGSSSENYIVQPDVADLQSFEARWWRRGLQERVETRALSQDHVGQPWFADRIQLFDGSQFRMLTVRPNPPLGQINSPDKWTAINRPYPFAILYYFQDRPYSSIVATGQQFASSLSQGVNGSYISVHVRHPDFDFRSFTFTFDEERRLIERELLVKLGRDPTERLYETHIFTSYEPHTDGTGETIEFPHKVVYHQYLERLPNGIAPEYTAQTITIEDIKFNVEIPDELFTLEFPAGTRVYDEVSGLGWLDEQVESPTPIQLPAKPGSNLRWTLLILNLLVLVAVASGILWRAKQSIRPSK